MPMFGSYLGMEIMQLVRQKLADVKEGDVSDPEGVRVDALVHHFRHLAVLVPVDVDATVHRKSGQLLVLFT